MKFEKSRDGEKIRLSMPLTEFEKDDMIEGGRLVGGRHWKGDNKEYLYFPDHYQPDIGSKICVKIVNLYVNLSTMDLVVEYKERANVDTQNRLFAHMFFSQTLWLFKRDFMK